MCLPPQQVADGVADLLGRRLAFLALEDLADLLDTLFDLRVLGQVVEVDSGARRVPRAPDQHGDIEIAQDLLHAAGLTGWSEPEAACAAARISACASFAAVGIMIARRNCSRDQCQIRIGFNAQTALRGKIP
jgi:hypothetical protein